MRFHVLTLLPDMFPGPLAESVLGRGMREGVFSIQVHDIRAHGEGRHKVVDDTPFGGGPGMVMKPGPLAAAIEEATAKAQHQPVPVVLLDPQGRRLTQPVADDLARHPELVLVCGHYEGIDERVRERLITDEISVGDFVLTGGELAAMVLIDAVARRIPGVLGSEESGRLDSFATGLLQHPQYTRPAEFRGWTVPEVLLSGDHAKVAQWRREQSLLRTLQRRPDLLNAADLTLKERRWLMDQGWEPGRS
jgi:tRNA (guanine37-N1)-methyltransferase